MGIAETHIRYYKVRDSVVLALSEELSGEDREALARARCKLVQRAELATKRQARNLEPDPET